MNSPATQPSADPLANLKDIHLPPEISWWPLAPGWWILLALVLVIGTGTFLFIRYHIRRNAYRKAALRELDNIHGNIIDSTAYLESISALLRRTAISSTINRAAKNRSNTASIAKLQGREWQQYLQLFMPAEAAQSIAIDRYQANPDINRQALYEATKQWIKRHKP